MLHQVDRLIEQLELQQHQLHLEMFPNQARNVHPMTIAFCYLLWSKIEIKFGGKKEKMKEFEEKHIKLTTKSLANTYIQNNVRITSKEFSMVFHWNENWFEIL